MKRFILAPALTFCVAISALASPVTVEETDITPYKIVSVNITGLYNGNVIAGVNKLLVDSVLVDGFCIDPFHFSLPGAQAYNSVALAAAPKDDHLIAGTNMTASEAVLLTKLWAVGYPIIGANAAKAAALQIAIWEVVGGAYFHLNGMNDYGAAALLVQAQNYNGALPNLIALTGPGQDFVIAGPTQPAPETGATVILLALALGVIAIARKSRAFSRAAGSV
ncbi:MAG: hypothetical protein M3Y86_10235 [Verrucomicrobiota bacterium]|nr:hypothetical protein [Verrucomicrobiota bacterium]